MVKPKFSLSNKKKAQLKIQQMAIMLVVVTIFFAMVGMLILGFGVSNLQHSANTIREENSITLAMKIANSAEFGCGNAFGETKINCIDLDKAMIIRKNIKNYTINSQDSFWGRTINIEISRIYPESSSTECIMGNYPNCGIIKFFDGNINSNYNFVLLCRKASNGEQVYNKCELGKIRVSYKTTNQ